jgi:dTMP kinase
LTDGVRGRLIAVEGIDGCGKSTQARLLADALGAVATFEPGATELGASLRHLLLDPGAAPVSDRAEVLLLLADRAQHLAEVVEPALASGRWVVTDRFSGSTLAYQGAGRELPTDELRRLVDWATGGLVVDLNVLVDVPVEVGIARRFGEGPDRFEGLGTDFQRRVARGFRAQAEQDPPQWLVVDGDRPPGDVAADIVAGVRARLGRA